MTEAERDRAEFEEKFPPPDDALYNEDMGLYCWQTHPMSMHPFNEQWQVWQEAKASEAGSKEPYGYVSEHTSGVTHFSHTFGSVYRDTAISITPVWDRPPAPSPVVPPKEDESCR